MLSMKPYQPLLEIISLFLKLHTFSLQLLDLLIILLLEVELQLFLLHIQFAFVLFFTQFKLVFLENYLRLELDHGLFLVDHDLGNLPLQLVDQLLLCFYLGLALLIVNSKIFVLNLKFVEQILDFTIVLTGVFLERRFS